MKSSELRIGNWINFDNLIGGKVNGTDINGNYQVTPRFFRSSMQDEDYEINAYHKPIPLTEEWLLKLGFVKTQDLGKNNVLQLEISQRLIISFADYDCNNLNLWQDGKRFSFKHGLIQYVHQLQNLYFALTGEELLIKP